jgi:hypothetical protein
VRVSARRAEFSRPAKFGAPFSLFSVPFANVGSRGGARGGGGRRAAFVRCPRA